MDRNLRRKKTRRAFREFLGMLLDDGRQVARSACSEKYDWHPPEEKQEAFVSQVGQGWFELDQSVEVGLPTSKDMQE